MRSFINTARSEYGIKSRTEFNRFFEIIATLFLWFWSLLPSTGPSSLDEAQNVQRLILSRARFASFLTSNGLRIFLVSIFIGLQRLNFLFDTFNPLPLEDPIGELLKTPETWEANGGDFPLPFFMPIFGGHFGDPIWNTRSCNRSIWIQTLQFWQLLPFWQPLLTWNSNAVGMLLFVHSGYVISLYPPYLENVPQSTCGEAPDGLLTPPDWVN